MRAVRGECREEFGLRLHLFDPEVVHPDSATEAMEYIATYLQRLEGKELQRAQEDMETLVGYAKEQKWPKQQLQFLKAFLEENGVGIQS